MLMCEINGLNNKVKKVTKKILYSPRVRVHGAGTRVCPGHPTVLPQHQVSLHPAPQLLPTGEKDVNLVFV